MNKMKKKKNNLKVIQLFILRFFDSDIDSMLAH